MRVQDGEVGGFFRELTNGEGFVSGVSKQSGIPLSASGVGEAKSPSSVLTVRTIQQAKMDQLVVRSFAVVLL